MLVVSVVTSPQEWPGLIEASAEDLAQMAADARSFSPEPLQELFAIFTQAEDSLRLSAHPRFVLETAAVRATRLLRRADGKSLQAMQPAQTTRPPQPAPVRTGQPVPPARSADPTPSSPPRPPQSTDTAPMPSRSSVVGNTAPPGGLSTNPPNVRSPGTAGEVKASMPVASPPTHDGRLAVTLNWEQFQEEVAAAFSNIAPFLEMGRLVGVDGHVVTIGFAKQATVARAMIEKPDNIAALTSMCERLSGQTVRLRIELDPPGPTMAQLRAAKEKEQRLVLFEQARAHPVVKQALEMFGAELAEVRPVSSQKEVEE